MLLKMKLFTVCLWLLLLAKAHAQTCPETPDPLPDFGPRPQMLIGIGAQKCATTELFNALKHHPQIMASHTKELFEFSKEDFVPTVERYEKYMRHWGTPEELRKAPEGSVFMEYTPKYMMVSL